MEHLTLSDKKEEFENDSTYDPEEMDKLLNQIQDRKYNHFATELEKLVYMNKNDKSVWDKLPLTPYDRVEILVNLLKKEDIKVPNASKPVFDHI